MYADDEDYDGCGVVDCVQIDITLENKTILRLSVWTIITNSFVFDAEMSKTMPGTKFRDQNDAEQSTHDSHGDIGTSHIRSVEYRTVGAGHFPIKKVS